MTLMLIRVTSGGLSATLSVMEQSGSYFIKDVEGMGPVQAEISESRFGLLDGTRQHYARRNSRNLVLKIGYRPNYSTNSVQSLRRDLYKIVYTKAVVDLSFEYLDGSMFRTQGTVESVEPDIFSSDPGLSVSIVCPDPDFVNPTPVVVSANSTSGASTYPVEYSGDSPTGVDFALNVNRSIAGFTFTIITSDGSQYDMPVTWALLAGDVVDIVTRPGSKRVYLTRAGSRSSILQALSTTAGWPQLTPGTNRRGVTIAGAGIPYTISYTNRYGGL